MRYVYFCLNPLCSSKEQKMRRYETKNGSISRIGKIDRFIIEKPEENMHKPEPCECCEKDMKLAGIAGLQIFSKMSLMSKSEKGEMLKQRSSKHFRTNGELRDRVSDLDERSGG